MKGFTGWADLQWISAPRWLIAHQPGWRGFAGDGHALVTVPALAGVLPGAGLVLGLLCGLMRVGYEDVFTESTALLALMVAVGAFSSQLGLLAFAGLCVGDLISAGPVRGVERTGFSSSTWFSGTLGEGPLATLAHEWLPRLILYLLLAAGMLLLPRAARAVVAGIGRGRQMPAALAWILVSGLVVVITWLGTDAWVAAAPTLVRPVFTWSSPGQTPTVEAVATLQESGGIVVAAAIAATVLRQLLYGSVMLPGIQRERLEAAERDAPVLGDTAAAAERTAGEPSAARQVVAAVLTAALATLAMAGILERAWLWAVVFVTLLVIRLARTRLLAVPGLPAWQRAVSLAPAWARLITLWLVSRVVVQGMSTDLIGSYSALAVFVLVSIIVVFAVFPGDPPADPRKATRPRPAVLS